MDKGFWPFFHQKIWILEQMNDLNYHMGYWDWNLDLTEGNMVLIEWKMVLIEVFILNGVLNGFLQK